MNDPIQTMPTQAEMCTKILTNREWLTYYRNVWERNLMARCIDVQTDTTLKAKEPDMMVQGDDNRPLAVKQRLELRKIAVQDAVDLLAGIDAMLAKTDEEIVLSYGVDALKVAEDMKPQEPKVGDACVDQTTGREGTLQDDQKGGLVCVVADEAVTKDYNVLKEWEVKEAGSAYFGSHAIGSVVAVDDDTAAPLVADGTLALVDKTPDAEAKI
jgi:hypothetical protein